MQQLLPSARIYNGALQQMAQADDILISKSSQPYWRAGSELDRENGVIASLL